MKAADFILKTGGLVGFPTGSVEGIGASPTSEQATQRIHEVKNQRAGHPLIVHMSDENAVGRLTDDQYSLMQSQP